VRHAVQTTGVKVIGNEVYVSISDTHVCKVSVFRGNNIEDIVSLRSSPCTLVWGSYEGLLVSSSETLYFVSGNEARPVLKAKPGNRFWHGVEVDGKVFVHEYGEPPTGIYVSENLKHFERVVTNKDIDPLSRHFHYLAFDRSRGILITSLGDGNVVRVATSQDYGHTWKPLYKGPWQFVPVIVDGDRWVFGFDSGIARGGVGIYYVEHDKWRFKFLRPTKHRIAQFMSLTKFDKYYVGCLGTPTALVVSDNLTYWHALYISNSIIGWYGRAEVWGKKIVAATDKGLLVFNLSDVEKALWEKPFLIPYRAYLDRIKGLAFTVKRAWWMLKL
jgi:hypothetical protein